MLKLHILLFCIVSATVLCAQSEPNTTEPLNIYTSHSFNRYKQRDTLDSTMGSIEFGLKLPNPKWNLGVQVFFKREFRTNIEAQKYYDYKYAGFIIGRKLKFEEINFAYLLPYTSLGYMYHEIIWHNEKLHGFGSQVGARLMFNYKKLSLGIDAKYILAQGRRTEFIPFFGTDRNETVKLPNIFTFTLTFGI